MNTRNMLLMTVIKAFMVFSSMNVNKLVVDGFSTSRWNNKMPLIKSNRNDARVWKIQNRCAALAKEGFRSNTKLKYGSNMNNFEEMTVKELKQLLKDNNLHKKEKGLLTRLKRKQIIIDYLNKNLEFLSDEDEGTGDFESSDGSSGNIDDSNAVTIDIQDDEQDLENRQEFIEDGNFYDDYGGIPFESLGLSRDAMNAVRAQPGWFEPTPIQQLAIPKLLEQNDDAQETLDSLWCEAPTGSGKTAAYALPLLQRLSTQRSSKVEHAKISSIVLCPTRELALQIGSVIQSLSSHMAPPRRASGKNWRIQVIHGGVQIEPQISSLARCADEGLTIDVLISTPGRLVDVLTYYKDNESSNIDDNIDMAVDAALERRLMDALDSKSKTDSSLSLAEISDLKLDRTDDDGRSAITDLLQNGIQYLILDEADRLLSRAFETEMDSVLDLLQVSNNFSEDTYDDYAEDDTQKERVQTWLFSATFPKQIEPRVDSVLKRLGGPEAKPPIRIACAQSDRVLESEQDVSTSLKRKLDRRSLSKQHIQVGSASTIQLRTIRLEQPQRTQALRRLLETSSGWDRVLVFVATRYASEHVARKLRRVGISAAELHGKLDQEARLRRLKAFSKGRVRVLLATDVASRGLDVVGLPAVVNYDLPRSTTDFVHRIGRTGRAGRRGEAVTFVTPINEAQYDIIEKRHLQEPVNREILEGFEPNEIEWKVKSSAARISAPGTVHSSQGLAHDRMYGGIKGRRKSKKDRLREKAAREAAEKQEL